MAEDGTEDESDPLELGRRSFEGLSFRYLKIEFDILLSIKMEFNDHVQN